MFFRSSSVAFFSLNRFLMTESRSPELWKHIFRGRHFPSLWFFELKTPSRVTLSTSISGLPISLRKFSTKSESSFACSLFPSISVFFVDNDVLVPFNLFSLFSNLYLSLLSNHIFDEPSNAYFLNF